MDADPVPRGVAHRSAGKFHHRQYRFDRQHVRPEDGIKEGLLTKYHQTYFLEQKEWESSAEKDNADELEETQDLERDAQKEEQEKQNVQFDTGLPIQPDGLYLKNLQILEYDMLYGNMDCYNGVNPYTPSDLQLGLHPIRITSVLFRKHTDMPEQSLLYIRGENFTECSVVFINGEQKETFYVNNGTLYVKNTKMEKEGMLELVVKQIGEDGEVLSETEPFSVKLEKDE